MNVQGIDTNCKINAQTTSVQPRKFYAEQKHDNYSFSINSCSENIRRDAIRGGGLFSPIIGYNYSGEINGKQAYFEEETTGRLPIYKSTHIQGKIDNKPIELTTTEQFSNLIESNVNNKGSFNGNDFDLNLTRGRFFKLSTIKGTINGENVEFTFPGSKVPIDETTKDILTSILMLNGCKAVSKGGEFKHLANSDWQQKVQEEIMMEQMMAQQMGMI